MAQSKIETINWDKMEEQVAYYRDHLDIFIEDQFPPIKLTPAQHVMARAFGRFEDIKLVCSRGFGKTWLVALCCFSMCCLYPGTPVVVCSGTAGQATLVLGKIRQLAELNPNIANEIKCTSVKTYVSLSGDKGKCMLKNGSTIESYAIDGMRGLRAKIIVADETPEIKTETREAIVSPIRNYRRELSMSYGFKDFPSKSVCITSACEKTNDFYNDFLVNTREMGKGSPTFFSCVFNYEAAIKNGITDEEFFMQERSRMPESIFEMEYNSIFIGQAKNSVFPYELTQACRTMENVETKQPRNTKSRYVIALDIATSTADTADNAVIAVVKFSEHADGAYALKLVYMRSFHGKDLNVLAKELRAVYHNRFPNAEKLIYDARGLGDSFHKFMDEPWIDPETSKEYPPLICDDTNTFSSVAVPILHAVRAVQQTNVRMATRLRVALEKRQLQLPVNNRTIVSKRQEENKTDMSPEDLAVFLEADALQFELANIVNKITPSGNYVYDTPNLRLHKDRYSALAMAVDYIIDLEEESIQKYKRGPVCIGIVSNF